MDESAALLALADRMLWVTALVSAPVLISTLAAGLIVGIIQAATSVNEQTLTFVPKLLITAGILVLFGGTMMTIIGDFAREIMAMIAAGPGRS